MQFIRILLLLLIVNTCVVFAQNPISQSNGVSSEKDYYTAVELFEKEKYAAAKLLFEQYIAKDLDDENSIKAQNYLVLCALYLKNPDFDYYVNLLVSKYPYHHFTLNTYAQVGSQFFQQGDYVQAAKYLKKLDLEKPNLGNVHLAYQLAYSYFSNKDYQNANKILQKIKGGEHNYAYLASYYAGYIAYINKDYANAAKDISKSMQDEKIKHEAELLLVSIYYHQKRYAEVINQILKSKQVDHPAYDLLLADSYLTQGDSAIAVQYFEKYIKRSKIQADRVLFYKMGIAYSSSYVNKLSLSTYYLSKVADETDSLAQIGAYQLGIVYIRQGEKIAAIHAFDKCRKLRFNKELQKSASFYYARLNFEIDDSKNAIEGCQFFEKNFPNDAVFMEEINRMRSEAYLNSGNYQTALQYIEKMPSKDLKAQISYQRIAYNYAVELFNNGEFLSAKSALRKSLTFPHNSELTNAAYFYLGEISLHLKQLDSALIFYQKIHTNSLYIADSYLGLGYAYFQMENYTLSIQYFEKYVNSGKETYLKEAYSKQADAYFKVKNFTQALNAYELALKYGSTDFAHNYYHRSLCLIELRKFREAEDLLGLLEEAHHADDRYTDWIKYQKAHIFYESKRQDLCRNMLSQIIDNPTDSPIQSLALLKRGDIYSDGAVYNRAVNDYKTIIEKFPNSEVAQQALQRLQDLNMKGIYIPNLDRLMSRLISPQASMSQIQSLELKNAQTHFENGDYAKAILTLTRYLQNVPASENTSEAEYLLGQSYNAIGDTERAGTYFERSKLKKGLLKSAQIDFQIGFFQSAISKFEKVLKSYAEENEQIEAKIGLIKAYFALKNYEKVMYYLTELKNSYAPHTHPVEHLYFGKLYFSQGQLDEAKIAFEKVIHATNDVHAAEAQYLIGLIYREQGDYLSSNEELHRVKAKYQNYTVWVYEALFAIADNYISLDNLFQAKATVQWIIDNSQDAKIIYRAKEKLMEWER
ncbi:MAG: hypothetical protein OHK0057_12570 [Thermoflexibacter sp.]